MVGAQGWEYRWFFPLTGSALDMTLNAVDGFRCAVSSAEERTDTYISASDAVGVKVAGRARGMQLEVKVASRWRLRVYCLFQATLYSRAPQSA
jgi:hypothetical protein